MIANLRRLTDRLFGRGDAATTIPPFDGPLKPNRLLETAPVLLRRDDAEDLATDGRDLYVAAGPCVFRLDHDRLTEVARCDRTITALCCLPGQAFAVAVAGVEARIIGGPQDGKRWTDIAGRPLTSVNALTLAEGGDELLLTDGSKDYPSERWDHDLMTGGRSGRAVALDIAGGGGREIANNLAYAFGICRTDKRVCVSESWAHRVIAFTGSGERQSLLENLPVYPSRVTPASGGGFWLTAFVARTQLVEFVLREPAYRQRMMREIDPRFWIAPKLSSGHSYLEPMQGAHIRTMGILKPWAPPRSYGLVIRLNADGQPIHSLHSRADGTHHGIVAAVECGGRLYALAKGCGKILGLSVAEIEQEFAA